MRRYSAAEPVRELRHIKIQECGEPLVDYLALCPKLLRARSRFEYRRESLLRRSVAEMLCKAADALPPGYRLAVHEGWRPLYIQRRMYQTTWERFRQAHPDWSDLALKRVVNRFTAPLDPRVPPPHTTGGAVDLWLAHDDGSEYDHTSPFERFDRHCFPTLAPGLSPVARENRRILSEALEAGGLTNYPSEYWHFSYGDQGWAYRTGAPHALYGPVVPENWTPDERDAIDAPLIRPDV